MKKVLGILLVGLMLVGVASAQENVAVDVALDGYSGYIFRGGVIGTDDKLVLQPSVGLTFGESGLSAGAWGSVFAQNRGTLDQVDEVDLWIDYSTSLSEDSPLGISIGFTEYYLPNLSVGTKHTEEAYVGLSVEHALSPSLTFYYDFGTVDAWYLVLGGGTDVPLGESEDGLALNIGASAALSNYVNASGNKEVGFHDITGTASITFPAGQFSITPTVGITYYDKVNTSNTSFWGGVSIGISLGGE